MPIRLRFELCKSDRNYETLPKKICTTAKAALFAALFFLLMVTCNQTWAAQMTVGTDISMSDVTDFYYSLDTSTDPPHYQRYRFYAEQRQYWFYHETREGGGWPQTEKDITASGSRQLSAEEWAEFFDCIKNGTVKNREEHLDDGDEGPWLFLYWKGDRGTCQEFSFASLAARIAFEAFCVRLRNVR